MTTISAPKNPYVLMHPETPAVLVLDSDKVALLQAYCTIPKFRSMERIPAKHWNARGFVFFLKPFRCRNLNVFATILQGFLCLAKFA